MFCHLNQRLAATDHIIWDAVVGIFGLAPCESRNKRPTGGGSRWKVRRRSRTTVPWGLCLSPEQGFAKGDPMKRIHINQHIIRRNHKTGEREPVITVKEGKSNEYAHAVEINGPSKLVYSPDKPLSCGARVWIETDSEVNLG